MKVKIQLARKIIARMENVLLLIWALMVLFPSVSASKDTKVKDVAALLTIALRRHVQTTPSVPTGSTLFNASAELGIIERFFNFRLSYS